MTTGAYADADVGADVFTEASSDAVMLLFLILMLVR